MTAGLGPEWTSMQTEKFGSQVVIRKLARPYPSSTNAGTLKVATPAVSQPAQAAVVAADFLSRHSQQLLRPLGLSTSPTNVLAMRDIFPTEYKWEYQSRGTVFTIVYAQKHIGIPVFEAEMRVRVTPNGQVWSVINRLAQVDPDLPTSPKLTAADALFRTRQVLGDVNATPESEASLFILAPSKLVWRLNFLKPNFQGIMINAITGDVVWKRARPAAEDSFG